jgi:hypothetical protein
MGKPKRDRDIDNLTNELIMEKNKYDFLIASISDIQGNIRALDSKVIAIIIILAIPVSQLRFLISIYMNLFSLNAIVGFALCSLLVISWISCLIFTFYSILSIDNPSHRIKSDDNVKGYFYGTNLFNISCWDSLFLKKATISKDLEIYSKDFSAIDIEKELIYEQMKLVFIREVKSKRQKIALTSAFFTIVLIFISQFIVLINSNLQ